MNFILKKMIFDKFADNLQKCNVQYVHPVKEHSWGQRVVRFYDPDRHIIEVGENMKAVCKKIYRQWNDAGADSRAHGRTYGICK